MTERIDWVLSFYLNTMALGMPYESIAPASCLSARN